MSFLLLTFSFPISPETEGKGCPLFLSATSQGQGRLNFRPNFNKRIFYLKFIIASLSRLSVFAIFCDRRCANSCVFRQLYKSKSGYKLKENIVGTHCVSILNHWFWALWKIHCIGTRAQRFVQLSVILKVAEPKTLPL